MTKQAHSCDRKISTYCIGGGIFYTVIVLAISLLSRPSIGTVLLAVLGGWGAWVICYLYFTKRDIHYASWAAKHGESPKARLLLLMFAIAWILLYPVSLIR